MLGISGKRYTTGNAYILLDSYTIMVEFLAYFAGFVDGEGCIFIGRTKAVHRPSISHILELTVSNTNREVLEELKTVFGGSIRISEKGMSRATTWKWTVTHGVAAGALTLLFPYLKVKSKEAKCALEFHELTCLDSGKNRGPVPLSDETIAQRDAYYWRLRELKKEAKTYA